MARETGWPVSTVHSYFLQYMCNPSLAFIWNTWVLQTFKGGAGGGGVESCYKWEISLVEREQYLIRDYVFARCNGLVFFVNAAYLIHSFIHYIDCPLKEVCSTYPYKYLHVCKTALEFLSQLHILKSICIRMYVCSHYTNANISIWWFDIMGSTTWKKYFCIKNSLLWMRSPSLSRHMCSR